MRLTKHAHACVEIAGEHGALLIDPGAFEADAARLVAAHRAVLITHEHFDHVDVPTIDTALETRPDLEVWGPAAVVQRWAEQHGDRVHPVRAGDEFAANGLRVQVHGDTHATIHPDIPLVANVGYLVEGGVYHPGDAYHAPGVPVTTLLVPTSGPWTRVADAADFIRAVMPERAVQIHEIMLSDIGRQSMGMFLGPGMLGPVPLIQLADGETLEL